MRKQEASAIDRWRESGPYRKLEITKGVIPLILVNSDVVGSRVLALPELQCCQKSWAAGVERNHEFQEQVIQRKRSLQPFLLPILCHEKNLDEIRTMTYFVGHLSET